MASYNIIGLMSGTSLDGLDIAYCKYQKGSNSSWQFKWITTAFYPYPPELQHRIKNAFSGSAWELIELDKQLARIWSTMINDFISKNSISKEDINAIASHGQTIFHRPDLGITTQIGCGQTTATLTGIHVVCDFRSKDVIHGGQGAPLVPLGEKLLFSNQYDAFLNIGGFSNITIIKDSVIAFDVCPGNLPLNIIAGRLGKSYDHDGTLAQKGTLIPELLEELNSLSFYQQSPPKSLGSEWLEAHFLPLMDPKYSSHDLLRTVCEHIATQIATVCNQHEVKDLFLSGGGALNAFLVNRLRANFNGRVNVPELQMITFKEALIFGLLGALRLEGLSNCLKDITGADISVSGGTIYSP